MSTHLESRDSAEIRPDPVIDAYKRDVDRTLLRENLKLTVEERIRRFESFMRGVGELRHAGEQMRAARRAVR